MTAIDRKKHVGFMSTKTRMRKYGLIYVMMLPGLVFYLVFAYIPMPGIVIAFKDYVPWYGLIKSEWVGIRHFQNLIASPFFGELVGNTILIAFSKILAIQFFSIFFAIFLNEMRSRNLKKIVQSVSILPYFVSWMVVSAIFYVFFGNDYAVANKILGIAGMREVSWYQTPGVWRGLIVGSAVWKTAGYQSIIYLSSIAAIDKSLYEAAEIDGAGRFRKMRNITIPSIMPTVSVMMILAMGGIMQGDFGQIYALVGNNTVLFPKVDVLDTFIYRNAFQMGDFSIPAAVGMFQSVVGLVMVILTNKFADRFGQQGIW